MLAKATECFFASYMYVHRGSQTTTFFSVHLWQLTHNTMPLTAENMAPSLPSLWSEGAHYLQEYN